MLLGLLLSAGALWAAEEKPVHTKSEAATQAHTSKDGAASLWLDPFKWTWVKSNREDTKIFVYQTGTVQARFITLDEPSPPLRQLEDTLARIQEGDPTARVVFTEERVVNGADVLCVQIDTALTDEARAIYYGYLFADEEHTVQLFTIAEKNTLAARFADLTELLNGLSPSEAAPGY